MKTIQTPDQLRENVAMLKRMMGEKTVIHLIPEQGMTQVQLGQCQRNASAFDNFLRAKHMTSDGADYSIQNLKTAYIFLRDNGLLDFEVAPKINKTQSLTDNYGRPVRDLRQEKRDAAARAAEEAAQPRRTIEQEQLAAQKRADTNRGIENLRADIQAARGKTHSATFKMREDMTKALDDMIANRRNLAGVLECQTEFRRIIAKYWE